MRLSTMQPESFSQVVASFMEQPSVEKDEKVPETSKFIFTKFDDSEKKEDSIWTLLSLL